MREKKKESMQQWDCFSHILPLSETSPFKKKQKKKRRQKPPRCAKLRNDLQDDSWSFRRDTQSWSQVPISRFGGRCGGWDDNHQGSIFAVGGGPRGGFKLQPICCYLRPENWRKWSNLTHIIFLQMGGWSSPTKFGKSNDVLEQL